MNEKDAYKDDRALIEGCKREEEGAQKVFDQQFRFRILRVLKGDTQDSNKAEELTQEIIQKCLDKLKDGHNVTKLNSWVMKVVKNHFKDSLKKESRKKAPKFVSSTGIQEKVSNLAIEDESPYSGLYLNLPQKIKIGLNRSIEQVEIFYSYLIKIKHSRWRIDKDKVKETFLKIEKMLCNFIGPRPEGKFNGAQFGFLLKFSPNLNPQATRELHELTEQAFVLKAYKNLDEIRNIAWNWAPPLKDIFVVSKEHEKRGISLESIGHLMLCALLLKTTKIKPARLIWDVWSKGLRKGRYTDRKSIRLAFHYFKEKTEGTERELLFKTKDNSCETLRKSKYKKPIKNNIYEELVDFIYRSSFT
jgi:hypothetical protein